MSGVGGALSREVQPPEVQPLSKRGHRETELDYQYRFRVLDLLGTIATQVIPWSALVGICYMLFGTLDSFAGKATFADIGIKLLTDFKISEGVFYLFGTGGVTYGLYQKRLRQKNISRMAQRPTQLEKMIDKKRSSSRLTVTGTTRPEDMP